MFQRWERLLFAHWRVDATAVASKLPPGLSLDLYSGQAWVAVTPFEITRLRLRGLPPLPLASRFAELNVRTYVTAAGANPGVWFFSLDAASRIAVFFARRLYHLPYFHARMACVRRGETVSYRSRRGAETNSGAEFLADYWPTGEPFRAKPGSLEEWLTARYRLYAAKGRELYRAEIEHEPWTLRRAGAEIFRNSMADSAGISLPAEPPLLHYSEALDVRVRWPEKVGAAEASARR